jgi:hypothetical protein
MLFGVEKKEQEKEEKQGQCERRKSNDKKK